MGLFFSSCAVNELCDLEQFTSPLWASISYLQNEQLRLGDLWNPLQFSYAWFKAECQPDMAMLWNIIKMPIKLWCSVILRRQAERIRLQWHLGDCFDTVDRGPGKTQKLQWQQHQEQRRQACGSSSIFFLGQMLGLTVVYFRNVYIYSNRGKLVTNQTDQTR